MKERIVEIIKRAFGLPTRRSSFRFPRRRRLGTMRRMWRCAWRRWRMRSQWIMRGGWQRTLRVRRRRGFLKKWRLVEPGFINFWLSKETVWGEFGKVAGEKQYGRNDRMKGRVVMVEYTDPNPFKLFHAGHLMSNAIGESISRLIEVQGADVKRLSYGSDIGLHVAKTIYAVMAKKMRSRRSKSKAKRGNWCFGRRHMLPDRRAMTKMSRQSWKSMRSTRLFSTAPTRR